MQCHEGSPMHQLASLCLACHAILKLLSKTGKMLASGLSAWLTVKLKYSANYGYIIYKYTRYRRKSFPYVYFISYTLMNND